MKATCLWVNDARTNPPTLCGFKPGPAGYCKKHARALKDLETRPRKCPRCGAQECGCGIKKILIRDRGR